MESFCRDLPPPQLRSDSSSHFLGEAVRGSHVRSEPPRRLLPPRGQPQCLEGARLPGATLCEAQLSRSGSTRREERSAVGEPHVERAERRSDDPRVVVHSPAGLGGGVGVEPAQGEIPQTILSLS